jgi:glycerol-3-phosphate dehydrogenase
VVLGSVVINTTGVWTDEIEAMAGEEGIQVRPSKGIHLVVPADRLQADTGMILRTETSVLFVVPWGRHWIIGTTDTDWNLDLAHPAASRADIDYLLDRVNTVLDRRLTHEDVEGVYAGLRPLLSGESDAVSKLSREHIVAERVPGLITVAGGKYTTYRVMAADAVDAAVESLGRTAPESTTAQIPLEGAVGYEAFSEQRQQLAHASGLSEERIDHLLERYGATTRDILDLIGSEPALGRPLESAEDYLAAEVHYAASHEGALHLDDVLTRRTRISIETWDRGVDTAPQTAELMGAVLGWDEATKAREVEHYVARVAAERDSQQQVDDRTADAARLGAPDVRTSGSR